MNQKDINNTQAGIFIINPKYIELLLNFMAQGYYKEKMDEQMDTFKNICLNLANIDDFVANEVMK